MFKLDQGGRVSGTWIIICCLSRCINRKLDWKQSSQASKLPSDVVPQHSKQWLNLWVSVSATRICFNALCYRCLEILQHETSTSYLLLHEFCMLWPSSWKELCFCLLQGQADSRFLRHLRAKWETLWSLALSDALPLWFPLKLLEQPVQASLCSLQHF